MSDFINLINSSLKGDQESLKVLLEWKITKFSFWNSKEEEIDTNLDTDDDSAVESLHEKESPIRNANHLVKFIGESNENSQPSSKLLVSQRFFFC